MFHVGISLFSVFFFVSSACLALEALEDIFSIHWGRIMQNNGFLFLTHLSLYDCYIQCRRRSKCLSFNYHNGGRWCTLNHKSKEQDPHNVIGIKGFVFSNRNDWRQDEASLCPTGENYDESNAVQPCSVTECDEANSIGNSLILGNTRSVGKRIKYMCHRNGKLIDWLISACLRNGSWTRSATFTCNVAGGDPSFTPIKGASQSSVKYDGVADRAIDGSSNTDYANRSCTHTRNEDDPWWQVTYVSPVYVTKVTLVNRQDCCSERLHNVDVTVDEQQCGFYAGPAKNTEIVSVICSIPLVGYRVKVHIVGSGYLSLCEVIIE